MKIKLMPLVLLLIILAGLCASCAGPGDENSKGTTSGSELSGQTGDAVETEEKPVFLDKKFDDRTFNILQTGSWDYDEFTVGEFTGDIINDAKYERNMKVENLYGIKITTVNATGASSNGMNLIQKDVMSNNGEYDLCLTGGYETCQMAYTGLITNLQDLDYIDLEHSWWDDRCTADLSIAGSTYFAVGDYSTNAFDCSYCILFNKDLIVDNDFENPYELVNNRKWTYDRFQQMVMEIYSDLNGDMKANVGDQFGLIVWQDAVFGMLNAVGSEVGRVNQKGELTLTIESEKNINVLMKFISLCQTGNVININANGNLNATDMFANNQGLFYTRYLASVRSLREYDINFGILPYPLWDEGQESYHTSVHSHGISMLCIPISVYDSEMSGAVAEAVAYFSQDSVRVAYYDVNLVGRYFTDNESAEMLDIILATRIYDAGRFYQVGNYYSSLLSMLNTGNTNISSFFTKSRRMAEEGIKTINEAYESLLKN